MKSSFEIRRIAPKSVFRYHWCSEGACCTPATFYLVLLPEPGTMRLRESRMRRCEKHAREDAASLCIPFPEAAA